MTIDPNYFVALVGRTPSQLNKPVAVDEEGHLITAEFGYELSDVDTTDGATGFYGYLDLVGNWYIKRIIEAGAITEVRFAKGSNSYATNWGNRASLTYDYFSVVF
jgi:hypothetical protein